MSKKPILLIIDSQQFNPEILDRYYSMLDQLRSVLSSIPDRELCMLLSKSAYKVKGLKKNPELFGKEDLYKLVDYIKNEYQFKL